MVNFLVFVSGAIVGACILFIIAAITVNRSDKKRAEEDLAKVKADAEAKQEIIRGEMDAIKLEALRLIEEYKKRRQQYQPPPPQQPASQDSEPDSVKERLRKAVEITIKQSKLDTKAGDDNLIAHNELELEKFNLLKTILADGFDPLITIRYNSGDQEMPLSTYVANIQKGLN